MHDAEKNASREEAARTARRRTLRRVRRFDMLIASMLLLLLLLGWVVRFAPPGQWPGGDIFSVGSLPHTWSGDALR
jgi:hypothetical protein